MDTYANSVSKSIIPIYTKAIDDIACCDSDAIIIDNDEEITDSVIVGIPKLDRHKVCLR